MPTLEKVLNVRLPVSTYKNLSKLTLSTGRTKSFLTGEALDSYISQQLWQISEVKAGIAEADRGEFATDAEMSSLFLQYAN